MTAQATVQRNSASVETEIRSLVMKRSSIESQQQRFSTRLLAIDLEIEQLKPRHFDGDTNAGPAIDKLEVEKRNLLRLVEGAKFHIDQFEEKIMPLRAELRRLNEIDEAQDARQRFEAFESKLNDLVSARIATYKAACRALFEEIEFIHSGIHLQPLNPAEQNLRLQAVERVRKRLDAVNFEVVNNKWRSGPGFAAGHLTTLVAKLPPETGNGLH